MITNLRQTLADLDASLAEASAVLRAASKRLEDVRARRRAFLHALPDVCAAIGVDVAAVRGEPVVADEVPDVNDPEGRTPVATTIALPSQPGSLRWHAGHVLYEHGTDLHVNEVAERMRLRGFQHHHDPANPRQLEQSLHALPHQVAWIVRGRTAGTLAIDVTRIRAGKHSDVVVPS